MPIEIKKYKCQYDTNGHYGEYPYFDSEEECKKHEKNCPYNPDNKRGKACVYGSFDPDTYETVWCQFNKEYFEYDECLNEKDNTRPCKNFTPL